MGKASSAKKVARAARTGGGRTRRGTTSWVWPSLMAVVVVLGTAGIVYSRDQRQPDNSQPLAAGPGRAGDHWHAAIGFYLCDGFLSSPPDSGRDPLGIHSHGDGVVHIHPFSSQSSGRKATLGVFFDTVDVEASSRRLKVPGSATRRNGDKCGDAEGRVVTKVWDSRDPADEGRLVEGSPADLRPTDNSLITVAFVPEGAEIPRPPTADNLSRLTDVDPSPGATSTTTSTTPEPATSTPVDPAASTTTAPPTAPTTTSASTSTSTTRP